MFVADFLARCVVSFVADGGAGGEKPGHGLCGRGDLECETRVVTRGGEFKRLRFRRDGPTSGRDEGKRAFLMVAVSANIHFRRMRGTGREYLHFA